MIRDVFLRQLFSPITCRNKPSHRALCAGNQHMLLHAPTRRANCGVFASPMTCTPSAVCSSEATLQTRTGLLSAGANAHGQFGRETASETGPGSVIVPDTRGCGGFRVWERTRTRRCSSGDGTTMVTWRLGRLTTSRRLSESGLRRPRK